MTEQASDEAKRASLFHYTDAGGLLGILRSSNLWATELRFLNDTQEAVYALGIFTNSLTEMINPALELDHPVHNRAEAFGEVFGEYIKQVVADSVPQTCQYLRPASANLAIS